MIIRASEANQDGFFTLSYDFTEGDTHYILTENFKIEYRVESCTDDGESSYLDLECKAESTYEYASFSVNGVVFDPKDAACNDDLESACNSQALADAQNDIMAKVEEVTEAFKTEWATEIINGELDAHELATDPMKYYGMSWRDFM